MDVTMDWQMISARVYSRGSLISAAIGKKPGVPAKEKTSDETAEIASTKVGLPKSLKSDSQGPVCGAAAGRPPTPTATVKVKTLDLQSGLRMDAKFLEYSLAEMMQMTPTQASQVIRPSVWILQKMKPMTAATATKTAVQAPWSESALRAMEMLSIPEPATKIQSWYQVNTAV